MTIYIGPGGELKLAVQKRVLRAREPVLVEAAPKLKSTKVARFKAVKSAPKSKPRQDNSKFKVSKNPMASKRV